MTQQELKDLIARAAAEGWTELDLSDKGLTELPPDIGNLTKLQKLHLGKTTWNSAGNQLTKLPPEIGQLINLTSLDLDFNQLTAVPPEIVQLTNLIALFLSGNQLTAVPPEISQLTNLTSLDLSGNQLTAVPSEIGLLANLTSLYLNTNQLTAVPPEISLLINLTSLELGGNNLTAVPPEIGHLTKLTSFSLSSNQLTAVPPEIGQLTNLTELFLYGNQLTAVPPEIGQLTNLIELDLDNNQLTAVPAEIGQLTNLIELDLSGNQLERLPLGLRQLTRLEHLDLRGNTDLGLSPEVLEQRRNPSLILDSYFADRQPLREAKLLLVGEGDVGKTALARRLLHNLPPDLDVGKTPGIDIHKWQITPAPDEPLLTLNLWDFGGQGVYQATHQFFFTHRSLYLVVISSRRGDNESRLHHWLTLVTTLSDHAPVIVVANKQDQHRLTLDERALQAQYPNLLAVIPTSCLTGSGIDHLRQTITAALAHLPHLNDTFPTPWFGLKQRLETMGRSYITYEHYCDYCQEAGITNRAHQRSWVQVLHQLGVVLNFQDRHLTATHVLKPNWVTDGIYRLLSDGNGDIARSGGILTDHHLDALLDSDLYPPAQHGFIVGMMQKFELCFPLPDRPNQFLIPDLLPEQQPDLPQLGFTATASALRFQYHYPKLLPNNILPRFMVGMMAYLDRARSWRSGAMLQFEQNRALVQADHQARTISITILGSETSRRALLTSIRMTLSAIHSTFANLEVRELVPIPTYPGETIAYRTLRNAEARGKATYYDGNLDADLDVQQLLAGIETPTQRRELELSTQINKRYGLEEVKQLCFDLDIEDEDLEGGEVKSAKIRALVKLMERRGRLEELEGILK